MKRRYFSIRVYESTPHLADEIARELGCLRVTGQGVIQGSAGVMLDRIARGEFKVVRVDQ